MTIASAPALGCPWICGKEAAILMSPLVSVILAEPGPSGCTTNARQLLNGLYFCLLAIVSL